MQLFNLLKKPFDWLRLAEPRVLNQQLTELFKTSDIPTVSVCIGIPILSFVLLDPDKPVQMTLWSLLLIASKVIGWWIIKQYKMQMPWLNNTSPKIFSLMLLMFIDGLVWASICSMDLRPSTNLHSMTVVSGVTGITVLYLIFSAPLIHMAVSFMAGEVISLAVQWLLVDESRLQALGFYDSYFHLSFLSQLLFISSLFWQTKNNSISFKQSIELRFANKDLYDQAEASRLEALQANADKSKFLAAASHDLRQPVHAQGLFLEVLGQTRVTPQQQDIIDSLRSATRATRDMLDSLLDFSRIEAGVIHPVKQNFPLQQLLHAIENDLAPVADAKQLAYRSRDTRMVADSDPALVDLILRNLVSNAIRYTDRGGVLVGCRQRGDKVVVEVCDTGIGIAPENQQDIFREFHQLGNPERDRRKGLGLGLAIVQGLTHTLGHRLTLSSIPGRGSVFRLELPLVNKLYPLEIDRPQAVEFTTPLRGYHALVIEDDDIVLQAMVSLLRSWGMTCDAAEGLSDAMKLAALNPPDVLVCDFRLREYANGTEVIAALRQALQQHTPALLITGDTSPKRLQVATRSGTPVLHKPVAPDDLYKALSSLLHPA